MTSTLVSSVPATTCAFVITSSGPMTNPVPSSCRLHDGALPRIFRTLFSTSCTTALPASAGSGGPTCVIGVGANGLNTSGKPELSSTCRRSSGSWRAGAGMTSSTARSTEEPRTPAARPGTLAVASGSATSQAATTTVAAWSTEPSAESMVRVRSPLIRSRMCRPKYTPVVSPSATSTTTTTMLTTTCVFLASRFAASSGASCTPRIAPPITPTNDSSATAMPWRHPETPATSARSTTARRPNSRGLLAADARRPPSPCRRGGP